MHKSSCYKISEGKLIKDQSELCFLTKDIINVSVKVNRVDKKAGNVLLNATANGKIWYILI